MLTGCRKNEIMTLRWEHFDPDKAEMRIVDGKTGNRTVHLSPSAVGVRKALPREPGVPWVVPGAKPGTHTWPTSTAPGRPSAPGRSSTTCVCTTSGTLVHQWMLTYCYYSKYFSSFFFRHHIVTECDLVPDVTCPARHRHLPLFSNRTQNFWTCRDAARQTLAALLFSAACDLTISWPPRTCEDRVNIVVDAAVLESR